MNKNMKMITTAPEGSVIARLTGPMVLGILGMIIFNLVDTYYVARLGTKELAALSFTFPVVMVVSSISLGLGVGMTAAVSKAAGREDRAILSRLITWGLTLALGLVILVSIAGQLTITPVFTLMGADETTLPLIREYMSIWYWAVIAVIIPMTGNAAIRGMGDTKLPSRVMLTAAVLNSIMDPLLIFGIGPFPRMGVAGAALATVLSRMVTLSVTLFILIRREKVISFKDHGKSAIFSAWKEILYVGIPNILSKLILPLGAGIITGMIAVYGREAVAGFGIATRIEMFALILIQAMVAVLPVFVGQNLGAGFTCRVQTGLKKANSFSLLYGIGMYILLYFAGKPIIRLINADPLVVDAAMKYIRLVPLAYGVQGMMLAAVTTMNVLKKPVESALLNLLQMFGIYIPLALAGSRLWGITGIFLALPVSYAIMGPLSSMFNKRSIRKLASC